MHFLQASFDPAFGGERTGSSQLAHPVGGRPQY